MHTIEQDPFQAVAARTNAGKALQAWCANTIHRYRLVFEPFSERVEIPRHDRGPALDALLARYAQRLEHYIRVAPYNWFNFYDFWQDAPAAEPAAPVLGGHHVGV